MFDNLPDEIICLINSYAANCLSNELKDDIKHKYIQINMKKFDAEIIDIWLFKTESGNLHRFIGENMTKTEMKHYFNLFDNCNCIKRKKPTLRFSSNDDECCCKKYKKVLEHCI